MYRNRINKIAIHIVKNTYRKLVLESSNVLLYDKPFVCSQEILPQKCEFLASLGNKAVLRTTSINWFYNYRKTFNGVDIISFTQGLCSGMSKTVLR